MKTTIDAMKQEWITWWALHAVDHTDFEDSFNAGWSAALSREEAQTVEPLAWLAATNEGGHDSFEVVTEFSSGAFRVFTHPAPSTNPSAERAALPLFVAHAANNVLHEKVVELEKRIADMLAADASDEWHRGRAAGIEECERLNAELQKRAQQVFKGPSRWTPDEIEAGTVGIRWVSSDGVHGRPTQHDVRLYLEKRGDDASCSCPECSKDAAQQVAVPQEPMAEVVNIKESGFPEIEWNWPTQIDPAIGMKLYLAAAPQPAQTERMSMMNDETNRALGPDDGDTAFRAGFENGIKENKMNEHAHEFPGVILDASAPLVMDYNLSTHFTLRRSPSRHQEQVMICQNEMRVAGKAYPRTCPRCGLGPCNSGWLERTRSALPRITHVAIQFDDKVWSLPAPNRHHHIISMIALANGIGINGPDVQGFLDSNGTFLNRRGAMQLAKDNGQLNRKPGAGYYQGSELFSEDLW